MITKTNSCKLFSMLFLLLFSLFTFRCQATITKINSFQELESYIAGDSTLLVLDVDFTLTQPKEPAFQKPNLKKHITSFRKIMKELTPCDGDILLSLAMSKGERELIESLTPSLIKSFQDKGVKVIALTGALTGRVGEIEHYHLWRGQMLKSFGYDFDIGLEDISFNNFEIFNDTVPLYHKGILFTNGSLGPCSKAELLVQFLLEHSQMPKQIIFVDDSLKYLQGVEEALDNVEVDYVGLHYLASINYSSDIVEEEYFLGKWKSLSECPEEK